MQRGLRKFSWYGQVILFAFVSGSGIFVYHYGYENAKRAQLENKQAALVRDRAEVARGRAAEQRLPEFRIELKDLESRFGELKAVLPQQRDVGDMLRRIQTLATQSGLVVKAFKPQVVTNKELHQEWPMRIELDGTYHDLGRFFDQVSKVPRLINVGSVSLAGKPEKNRDATDDGTTITAGCTATTFVLLDKPAIDAAAAAATTPRATRKAQPGAGAAAAK
jgi:type IV pilus assembly protein PilO